MKSKLSALCVAALAVTVTGLAQPATPTGYIKANEFLDIPGTVVTDLTGNPKFPNSPDIVSYAGYFEWPQATSANINDMPPGGIRDNYGLQIIGYLHPQTSGNYTFWISADDQGELWLSTDSTAANKRLIAREPQWNNARDYAGVNAEAIARRTVDGVVVNQSAPIPLVAGQAYYIEALMKEGGGGDNLSVAWSSTGTLPTPALPIAGQFLSPIDYTTTPAPAIITQPADIRVAIAGQPLTFTAVPNGPWDIQWTKTVGATTSDIPGATGRLYTFNPTTADAGSSYAARVSNAAGTVTSRSALLQEVDPVVADQLTRGFLKVDHYGGIGGVLVFPDLYNAPSYIARTPEYTFYTPGAFVPQTAPDLSNFGRVLTGWVQPPTGGEYRFFIRSDDGSEVHVSTGTDIINDPEDQVPAAEVTTPCCQPFQEPAAAERRTSEPINLTAGQRYGITILYKEAGGGDYVYVAWRLAGDTTPAGTLQPIGPGNVWTMANPSGRRYDITRQPVAQTVVEARTATFEVAVSAYPAGSPFGVQWTRNGADIPGATAMSYTTPILTMADNGATYAAKFYTLRGEVLSSNATLTVVPDTFPPGVVGAGAVARYNSAVIDIGIEFDEGLGHASAINLANYSISKGTITGVSHYEFVSQAEHDSVKLAVTGLANGDAVTVTVTGVSDRAGNAITTPVQVSATVNTSVKWVAVGGDRLAATPPAGSTASDWVDDVIPLGDGGFDLISSSAGHWDAYDEQTFVYEELTGDFTRVVLVEFQDITSQWARQGLMAREDLNAGEDPMTGTASRNLNIRVNPATTAAGGAANNGTELVRRVTTGGNYEGAGGAGRVPLYGEQWLRIRREGNTLLVDWSVDDGATWSAAGTWTPGEAADPIAETLFVGPFYAPEMNNNDTAATLLHSAVARFRHYGESIPVMEDIMISIPSVGPGGITVTWTGGGEAEVAESITGPWTPTGNTSGTFTLPLPEGAGGGFLRIQRP